MQAIDIPEVEKQYQDEWLLFEVYEVDKQGRPIKGKLLAHSPSLTALDEYWERKVQRCHHSYVVYCIFHFALCFPFGDASKTHLVPKVLLKSFSLADAKIDNLEALSYTIPEEYGIDGVVGLNFLRQFNISLDFERGMLTLNRFG